MERIRLDEDEERDRSRYEQETVEAIRQGLQDVAEGKVSPHDELFDRLLAEFAGEQGSVSVANPGA